jgi:hypothetical protein
VIRIERSAINKYWVLLSRARVGTKRVELRDLSAFPAGSLVASSAQPWGTKITNDFDQATGRDSQIGGIGTGMSNHRDPMSCLQKLGSFDDGGHGAVWRRVPIFGIELWSIVGLRQLVEGAKSRCELSLCRGRRSRDSVAVGQRTERD